jgi:hypothetical protein
MQMSIEITGRQRELLYEFLTDRLTGIDSVWRFVADKDWEEAKRCGREYADFLLLLGEGLGWEPEWTGPATLMVSPIVLGRALKALKLDASVEDCELQELRLLVAKAELKREETINACDELQARMSSAP